MSRSKWMALALAALLPAPAVVAETEDSGWEFKLRPTIWLPSVSGDTSTGDVSAGLDVSASEAVAELQGGLIFNIEVRRKRLGVLAQGMFAELSVDAPSPGPFFNMIDTTFELDTLDLALFGRVLEGEEGWIDLLVGARYFYLGVDLDMQPDYAAADDISSSVVNQAVDTVSGQVGAQINSMAEAIAAAVATLPAGDGAAAHDLIRSSRSNRTSVNTDRVVDQVGRNLPEGKGLDTSWGGERGTTRDALRGQLEGRVERSTQKLANAVQQAIAEVTQKRVDRALAALGPSASPEAKAAVVQEEIKRSSRASVHDLKRNAAPQTGKAIDQAEAELTGVIESAMDTTANADISETREWVDPYVGLRGRWNMTERFFVGARGDLGGVGVGSDLVWQVFAGVGYDVGRHFSLELGWRYLSIDYEEDDFVFDAALSGPTVGMGFTF